jgi:hypothetical protein
MIMDILTNPVLMKKENFAEGYDIISGDVDINHVANRLYGEIHTGDEWLPARNKFCKPHDNSTTEMPIALVIFGDKSHTDLHGALSLTPIIFTLTLFNQKWRNDPQIWRVLGYVPVSEFASQVAIQHHNMIVTANALRTINSDSTFVRNCKERRTNVNIDHVVDDDESIDDDLTFRLSGQYSLCVSQNLIEMESVDEPIYPKWKTNKYGVKDNNYKYSPHPRLVKAVIKYVSEMNIQHGLESRKIDRYTRLTSVSKRTGERIVYHANPHIQGRMWYDWAFVHFQESDRTGNVRESYYPSRILGFINGDRSTDSTAIVQCTKRPLDWFQLEKNFLMKVVLGIDDEVDVVSVPITALVHPLCVIPDFGGDGNSYLVVLPRRNWSRYFGNEIR